jgi:hypothetical protein
MSRPEAATCPVRTCHVTVWPPRQLYGLPRQLYDLPSQHQNFAYLARRTDRDNFSIRTPFAKINIPPESGERDGRNGTVFVAFRAL